MRRWPGERQGFCEQVFTYSACRKDTPFRQSDTSTPETDEKN